MTEGTKLTSTSVSDALQQLGGGGVLGGLTAYSDVPLLGTAFTVLLCGPEESSRPFNDFIDELPEGAVAVVDNCGRAGFSVFGGLMTAEALRHGAVGAVVNGEVRDVAEARGMGFGLFARGRTPRSGAPVTRLQATGVPMDWAGVRVEPGDTVVADGDGVVVVPARHAEEVLARARAIEAADYALMREVTSGVPLAVARAGAAGAAGGRSRSTTAEGLSSPEQVPVEPV